MRNVICSLIFAAILTGVPIAQAQNAPAAPLSPAVEAFFEAIERQDTRALQAMVKQGLHLSARNEEGESPLIVAADKGSVEILRLLLEAHSDSRLRTRNGETALHVAAMQSDPDFVLLLLKAGAEPNAVNLNGETPLAWAAMTGTLQAARALLEGGALIEPVDEHGNTPLHGAAKAGNIEMVEYLLARKARPALRNSEGMTAHDLAVERDYPDVASLLKSR